MLLGGNLKLVDVGNKYVFTCTDGTRLYVGYSEQEVNDAEKDFDKFQMWLDIVSEQETEHLENQLEK